MSFRKWALVSIVSRGSYDEKETEIENSRLTHIYSSNCLGGRCTVVLNFDDCDEKNGAHLPKLWIQLRTSLDENVHVCLSAAQAHYHLF